MLWPPSFCTCQLLSLCGLQNEQYLEAPLDDTEMSEADSECHCAARIPSTIPQNETPLTVFCFDAYVPELPRILVTQNLATPLRNKPTITSNSLFMQHCALIL